MPKSDRLPTLEPDDSEEQPSKSPLPPFVLLKRGLACLSAGIGIMVGIAAIAFPEKPPPSENQQIANWVFVGILIAVGAWLWGGKDLHA